MQGRFADNPDLWESVVFQNMACHANCSFLPIALYVKKFVIDNGSRGRLVPSFFTYLLLTELSRSVWENLDLGHVYRPHCVRSVLTTSVKILPYRPPARLIRGKYLCSMTRIHSWKNGLMFPWVMNFRFWLHKIHVWCNDVLAGPHKRREMYQLT